MVNQIKIVSIFMIVHGSLGGLTGIATAAAGPAMMSLTALNKRKPPTPQDEQMMAILTPVLIVWGCVIVAAGIMNIVAGIRGLKFRGRVFAIVALFSNLAFLGSSLCCWPTSIGLMVYGLIVMFNGDVGHAFQRVADGEDPRDVLANPERRRHDDDYYDRDDDDYHGQDDDYFERR